MAKKSTFLDGYKENLETLKNAIENGDVALLECLDSRTGKKAAVLVAIGTAGGDSIMAPFAIMCEGNPYDYLQPPAPEGGFCPLPGVEA
jgi:hypothetical protein